MSDASIPTEEHLRSLSLADLIPMRTALALRANEEPKELVDYDDMLEDAIRLTNVLREREANAPEWVAEVEQEPSTIEEPEPKPLPEEVVDYTPIEEVNPIIEESDNGIVHISLDDERVENVLRKLVRYGLTNDEIWEVICLARLELT